MRILLDTHVLIWSIGGNLPNEYVEPIKNLRNQIFVSTATIWEISIKKKLGKLIIPNNLAEVLKEAQFQILPIEIDHIFATEELPLIHNDPFDRMLIAQAQKEGLMLASRDKKIAEYDLPIL